MSSVDVVIPCYNYGRYLRQCVQSALDQDGVDVRVLVIDDCSSDDTERVGREMAARDARVEFRRHPVNRGHIATYNEGLLGWASRDYCLLLSADDLPVPGAFRRAATVFERHPDVAMVYGTAIVTETPDLGSYVAPAAWAAEVVPGIEYIRTSCRTGVCPVWTPTAFVRTAVQHRIGGYRPELPHAGDMDMWLRCAAVGSIAKVDCLQAYYRRHQTQMNKGFRGLEGVQQRQAVFDLLLAEGAGQVPDLPALHRQAMNELSDASMTIAHACLDRGDVPSYRTMVRYARHLSPSGYSRAEMAKLRFKYLLGPRLSEVLRNARASLGVVVGEQARRRA